VDDTRRAALRRGALQALVRANRPELAAVEPDIADLGFGPAMSHGGHAVVLVESDPERALGPALLWAERAQADRLELWARAGADQLARRAGYFRHPPEVWEVAGTDLVPAVAAPVRQAPELDPEALTFAALLREAGALVVDDHGVLVGELDGL
jgi:hypothetical protein